MAKKQVQYLRDQVTSRRLELRELRAELRQRHVKIRQMEAQFWRSMQTQWNDNTTLDKSALQLLFDDIQRALDELGPEESNYDEKEDDLDLLEYKLGKIEDRFYHTDEDLAGNTDGFPSASSSSSSRRSQSTDPTRPEDEASWNYRYLSRLGDANIVRERLADLSIEKSHYVDLERDRSAMGLDLYKPNVEFLDTFEDVYASHEFELREIEEDLQRLLKESHSTSPTAREPFGPIDLPQDSISLTHEHEVPKSHSHGDTRRRKSDCDLRKVQVDPLTIRHCINQWILEILEVSAFERARHRAWLDDPNLDERHWWSLVLDYWQSDQAAKSPPSSRRRGSKSLRSSSVPVKSFSHSTGCISKLHERDVGVGSMDDPPDMNSLPWDTASNSLWKPSVNDNCRYESPSPHSLYQMNDYFDDQCEIYSTSKLLRDYDITEH